MGSDRSTETVLSWTFAVTTAGTPSKLRYNEETGAFLYVYHSAAAGCAPTEIYYPAEFFDGAGVGIDAPCEIEWSYDREKEVIAIPPGCEGEVRVGIKRER